MSQLLPFVFLLVLGAACANQVGDECESNTDCGIDLVCDLSQSGGYCTSTPCTTNGCPEESVCIRFDNDSTWCMLRCDDNSDCRDGYVCEKNFGDAAFCAATSYTPEQTLK